MTRHIFYFIASFLTITVNAATLNFQIDADVRNSPCVKNALTDFTNLMENYTNTKVATEKETDADIQILFIKNKNFITSEIFDTITKYGGFEWEFSTTNGITNVYLRAQTYKGFSDGLYALLQEKLNFKFYHARAMITPANKTINWNTINSFSGKPVFQKMGFHIHTMHPLELTESLLDEKHPDALKNVKEYIDWLARNGQNYFEFNLLESINKKDWITHAKNITDYAHSKGIFCGIDLSIHMIQQKAFQLYSGKMHQQEKIEKNTLWLLQANFDLWNVELSSTEFSQGDQNKKSKQIAQIASLLEKNGVKLMSRSHVVQPDKMVSGSKVISNETILNPKHGLMVHTVMFYSLSDSIAPVYENKNLQHMRNILLKEKDKREVWYYPESAYWITFDNSVPMLLLPYLSARLDDINYCMQENVTGHLTFSSGAEWGYWLIDWSIARWCWNYYNDGIQKEKQPLQYVNEISEDDIFKEFVIKSLALQQQKIKDEQLIRVMDAQTITDEIGGKLNLEFHPRPKYSYKYIRNKASVEELNFIKINYLDKLQEFITQSEANKQTAEKKTTFSSVEQEIYDGINITYLRGKHRFNTLSYLVNYRMGKITRKKNDAYKFLDTAAIVRNTALIIVRNREKVYRYPEEQLTEIRFDHTCYHFGYLFPVHNLHFWKREEMQAKHNKYKFMYMKIWNIARIVGLIN